MHKGDIPKSQLSKSVSFIAKYKQYVGYIAIMCLSHSNVV